MSYLGVKRHEIEEAIEHDLLKVAEAMIPDSPGEGDLHLARPYFPSFFGGQFPAVGLAVERTEGESRSRDKPDLPAVVRGRIIFYHPSLPVRGADTLQDDRTGEAKSLTRRLRGEFIERVFKDSKIGRKFRVVESLAADRDPVGNAQADERGRDILWRDQTSFEVDI